MDAENPPAENPPVEDPPAENPPAEDPPAEDPPAAEEQPKEDPPAEDPPAEDPPAEDKPAEAPVAPVVAAAEETKPALGLGDWDTPEVSDRTTKRKPVRTQFCCCICECSNIQTRGKTCLCCIPIKTGLVVIGLVIWLIAFQQFLTAYFKFMNATLPWWYPFVDVFLFAPGFIGVCFFIGWFTLDCRRTRATLTSAIIQSLVSYVLILTWHTVFLCFLYKQDKLGHGFGEDLETYTWTSKKHTLYYELAWGVVAIVFFIIALSAVRTYVNCYPEDDKEEPEASKAAAKDEENADAAAAKEN